MWLNPLALLGLTDIPLEDIGPEDIRKAKRRLFNRIELEGDAALMYKGCAYNRHDFEQAILELEDPPRMRAYHALLARPVLSGFLDGQGLAGPVEANTFNNHDLMVLIGPALTRAVAGAWEKAITTKDPALAAQLHQFAPSRTGLLPAALYRAAYNRLAADVERLEQLPVRLRQKGMHSNQRDAEVLANLFSQDLLRQLPPFFDDLRDRIALACMALVKITLHTSPKLVAQFGQFGIEVAVSPEVTGLLKLAMAVSRHPPRESHQRQQRKSSASEGNEARAVIQFLVLGVWVLLMIARISQCQQNNRYDRYNNDSYAYYKEQERQRQYHERVEELRRELAEAQGQSQGQRAQEEETVAVVEATPLMPLPAKAYPQGLAPLTECLAARPNHRGESRTIVITGDEKYDAVVFLFSGHRYIAQVYVGAGADVALQEQFIGRLISTFIVFGQDWSTKALNPCGHYGWFTCEVRYAGFDSYATVPFPVSFTRSNGDFQLKQTLLDKSREMKEADFLAALRKYL